MGASLEASSVERCSPETVPHSLSRSSSSSLNSPCSFPEPWPAATAEPASMNILGPQYSFKTICMLAGQPGLPTGFNIPLELPEGPKHEEFPTDGRDRAQSPVDVEPPPGSPSAMVTENLAEELIHIVQDALKMTKQCKKFLRMQIAKCGGAACAGALPRVPSPLLTREEEQPQPGLLRPRASRKRGLRVKLPQSDTDTDNAADGDKDKHKETRPGRSSSIDVEPPPGSPSAIVTKNRTKELMCITQDTLKVTEQYERFLQRLTAMCQKAACAGALPRVPSPLLTREEEQPQPGLLRARVSRKRGLRVKLPGADADKDNAADGDKDKHKETRRGRSCPIDVQPPPGSPSAMVTENHTEEFMCIMQDTLENIEQYERFLQMLTAKWRGAACAGALPRVPSPLLTREEEQPQPGLLRARVSRKRGLRVELPGADADKDNAADGDKDKHKETRPGRSSSIDVEPPPGSPSAIVTKNRTKELMCITQDTLKVTEQYERFLQRLTAMCQKAACAGALPRVPSPLLTREEEQPQPGLLRARVSRKRGLRVKLPGADADKDNAADGDKDKHKETRRGRSCPIDVQPPPGSPSAMVTENHTEEFMCIMQDTLENIEQYERFLQMLTAKWRGAACAGALPRVPSPLLTREEEQPQPGLLRARVSRKRGLRVELPGADADKDNAADGDKDKHKETRPGRSSSIDVEPPPGSPSAIVTKNRTKELMCITQDTLKVTEQYERFLQRLTAMCQKAACAGALPRVPSPLLTREEEQPQPGLLRARVSRKRGLRVKLPGADADKDNAADGDKDKHKETRRGRSSPVQAGRRSPNEVNKSCPTGPGRSSPVQAGRTSPNEVNESCPTGPGRSSTSGQDNTISVGRSTPAEPSPQQQVPTGRACDQAAPALCWAGRCLQKVCSCLCSCLKDWWRRLWRPRCICFCKTPPWQR
ncbi:uncharacterized protein LOC129735339 isoform X2 [Falco cherrug]|uniref:uncharacterized protein LOC129735339 isoform X2 n=1 Tax=Falco cherrug TaxID=345164 RepID=UPI0024783DAA|nr:uncharacterized protein LOC129735339 isoform X2 [Falco cherrug]